MIPDNNTLEKISEKLRLAVIATLGLDETEQVFVGNEEKLFLLALFQNMPDSGHPTSVKISNYKDITYFRMIDIWSSEIAKRPRVKQSHPLSEKIRYLIITTRNFLIKLKHLIFLMDKLKHTKKVIHYAAHLRYANFTIPNLTDYYINNENEKDSDMRKSLSDNLKKAGLDSILIEYLTHLFPTSHLESYSKFTAHKISNIKIATVFTSIYGVMGDPLLSFLIKNNNSNLAYVQHGGGYGLNKEHQAWQIEQDGANIMYYWGTGDNNVYPTRYRNKYFSRIQNNSIFILSDKQTEQSISFYEGVQEQAIIKYNINSIIVAHPNGPRFNNKRVQYGIGYKQHEQAQLVIYDRPGNSFLYSRILSKRPFLILEGNYELNPDTINSIKFISLLKTLEILIPKSKLEKKINYWMKLPPKEAQNHFKNKAKPFLDHVLGQPKLETILRKSYESKK